MAPAPACYYGAPQAVVSAAATPVQPPPSPWRSTLAGGVTPTVCLVSTDAMTTYIADMCNMTLQMWQAFRTVQQVQNFKVVASVLCPEMWMRRHPRLLAEVVPRIMEVTVDHMQDVCRPHFEITCDKEREMYSIKVHLISRPEIGRAHV